MSLRERALSRATPTKEPLDELGNPPPIFLCQVCDQTPERGHAPDCPGSRAAPPPTAQERREAYLTHLHESTHVLTERNAAAEVWPGAPTEPATGRSEWRLLDSAREVDNYLVRGDRVLMSDGHMVCMGHLAKYPDGVLRGSVDFGNGMPQDWGITHWMPLPELPAAPVSPATKDGDA